MRSRNMLKVTTKAPYDVNDTWIANSPSILNFKKGGAKSRSNSELVHC